MFSIQTWYSQLKDHQGLTNYLAFLGTVAHTSTDFVEFQMLHHTQHYLHIDYCKCHNWFGIGLLLQNGKQIRWYLYLHQPLHYIKGCFKHVLQCLHLIFHFCTYKVWDTWVVERPVPESEPGIPVPKWVPELGNKISWNREIWYQKMHNLTNRRRIPLSFNRCLL